MNAYRESAWVTPDLPEEKQEEFVYYEINGYSSIYHCPACSDTLDTFPFGFQSGQACSHSKRINISGMWWWGKRCPLDGTHLHFKCRKCGSYSVRFVDKKNAKRVVLPRRINHTESTGPK